MPLGWIDFSKIERNKVLSVLELLSERDTLDELGIAPIRDGFANIFFPGTSTIQTRAKYFLIVPYALKDLELSNETNPNSFLRAFDEIEKECGERLLDGDDTEGVIGSRSLAQGQWVKRTPAEIYWGGLRNYGIFTGGNLSLTEYVRAMCAMKKNKTSVKSLGNRNDSEENDGDDKDAGDLFHKQFWHIPTYTEDWIDDLSIKLTEEEGKFLRRQIILSFPDSMMAYILKNDLSEILGVEDFASLDSLIHLFPEQIQSDYALATDFSNFLYVIRVLYNLIISEGENDRANSEWKVLQSELVGRASLDLEAIFNRLQIHGNGALCEFLRKEKKLMLAKEIEGMQDEIRRRERFLKEGRARTMHPGEFDTSVWYGGGALSYRFSDAKVIMRDIFESEESDAKS